MAGAAASVLVLAAGAWIMRISLAFVLGYQRLIGGIGGIVVTLGRALINLPMCGAALGASLPAGIVFGGFTLVVVWPARVHRG